MKTIHSASNATLKQLAKLLQHRRARVQAKQAVIEGIHLLQTFLAAQWPIVQVYVPQHRLHHSEVATLLLGLPEALITVVGDTALSKITSLTDADDVMAVVEIPALENTPITGDCVLLERVQDPGNVGTILRSALAAGVHQVVLSPDCADVFAPKVLRAAMGAHAHLHLFPETDLAPWCTRYQHAIHATALNHSAKGLYGLDLRHPCAWLFGNEGVGISNDLLQAATDSVMIPMSGQTESLNVAMAATVCLFEQQRQRLLLG